MRMNQTIINNLSLDYRNIYCKQQLQKQEYEEYKNGVFYSRALFVLQQLYREYICYYIERSF